MIRTEENRIYKINKGWNRKIWRGQGNNSMHALSANNKRKYKH